MDQPDHQVEPNFTHPIRQITLMVIVLATTCGLAFLALPRVLPVFEANPYLNGFILLVFIFGVLTCFWQVFQLIGSVRWISDFASANEDHPAGKPPRLLVPLASLLGARQSQMQIATGSARSILDSVAQRIDEAREITRYIVSLLIFLGLLGTFYGLATTVPAVVDTIRSLNPQEGEGGLQVFNRLMSGLEAQLGGMGVAFASSLLGLAGSLVVGLLELFASHGQNRFYRELEEWMTTITQVGIAGADGEGGADPAAIMTHMAQQMDQLQQMVTQSDVNRAMVDEKLGVLADAVEGLTQKLTDQTETQNALVRIAESQEELVKQLTPDEDALPTQGAIDAESRMRLRSMDTHMARILEELSAGRQESMTELKRDLTALTKAVLATRSKPAAKTPPKQGK